MTVQRGDKVWFWARAFLAPTVAGPVPIPAMKLRAEVDRMYRRRRAARIRVWGPGKLSFFTLVPLQDLTMRRRARRERRA